MAKSKQKKHTPPPPTIERTPSKPTPTPKTNQPQRKRKMIRKQRPYWLWALITLTIIVIAGIIFWNVQRSQTSTTTNTLQGVPANEGIDGVLKYDVGQAGLHKNTAITYPVNPPVGGPHNGSWQNCGIYNKPIQNEYAVHSLEHGAVWVTYRSNLPQDEIQSLKNFLKGRTYILLSPKDDLPSPIVASAWGYQLKLDKADDPRLSEFLIAYTQGPQTPEPGASCTGANGTPDE